jgi:hypothetical protein
MDFGLVNPGLIRQGRGEGAHDPVCYFYLFILTCYLPLDAAGSIPRVCFIHFSPKTP